MLHFSLAPCLSQNRALFWGTAQSTLAQSRQAPQLDDEVSILSRSSTSTICLRSQIAKSISASCKTAAHVDSDRNRKHWKHWKHLVHCIICRRKLQHWQAISTRGRLRSDCKRRILQTNIRPCGVLSFQYFLSTPVYVR